MLTSLPGILKICQKDIELESVGTMFLSWSLRTREQEFYVIYIFHH